MIGFGIACFFISSPAFTQDKVLDKDSDEYRAIVAEARSLHKLINLGKLEKASNQLLKSDARDSGPIRRVTNRLIHAWTEEGDFEDALPWIEAIYRHNPNIDKANANALLVTYAQLEMRDPFNAIIKELAEVFPNSKSIQARHEALLDPNNPEPVFVAGVPPLMPFRAKRSGYCIFSIEISETGLVTDITSTKCTESTFRK